MKASKLQYQKPSGLLQPCNSIRCGGFIIQELAFRAELIQQKRRRP